MSFGDVLKKRLNDGDFLRSTDSRRNVHNAFWVMLKDCAISDIESYAPNKIDSDVAVSIYYDILSSNMVHLPDFACRVLPSNNQERFRVANRNMFTSNAFHPDGIANHPRISAEKSYNSSRKGEKITFQWIGDKT